MSEQETTNALKELRETLVLAHANATVNEAIIRSVLPKLYGIIDTLINGADKKTLIEARRMLPAGYKNSFTK